MLGARGLGAQMPVHRFCIGKRHGTNAAIQCLDVAQTVLLPSGQVKNTNRLKGRYWPAKHVAVIVPQGLAAHAHPVERAAEIGSRQIVQGERCGQRMLIEIGAQSAFDYPLIVILPGPPVRGIGAKGKGA